jgi:uncharacterized Zn-binding protein involved in type VI secretion
MSFPAARIADMTMHGGAVNLGAPTTLIGGMPASRIGDIHVCPMVTVLVPHATGPIVLGAFNVLVGGPPQARMLDMCLCVGPPSMITLGAFTTLVGMAGAFAGGIGGFLGLVLGAVLAGVRNATSGYPRTVRCPKDAQNPAGYKTQYSENITVEGTPEFQAQTCKDLDTIASTKAGQNTLGRIENSGKSVTIRETTGGNACDEYSNPAGRMRSSVGGTNGAGSDSVVDYNPNRTQIGDGSEPWMNRPADVGLEHELNHSADAAEGAMDPGTSVIDGRVTKNREAQAVGLGPYSSNPGSENAYRAERGQPLRPRY